MSHAALLRHLDRDGTRAGVLAERTGLTPQAITQMVDDLQRLGYVSRVPDPADGRAKIVAYTDAGRAAFDASRAIIAELEAAYADRVGARRYATLRAALTDLLDRSGP